MKEKGKRWHEHMWEIRLYCSQNLCQQSTQENIYQETNEPEETLKMEDDKKETTVRTKQWYITKSEWMIEKIKTS